MKNICLVATSLGMGGLRNKYVTWQIVFIKKGTMLLYYV